MSNTPISTAGIYGTDNVTPSYDPSASFHIWKSTEIYTGGPGLSKHVPKVGDLVVFWPPLLYKEVVAINEQTCIPELVAVKVAEETGEFSKDDLLKGVGGGSPIDTFRLYIDKSVTPHSLTVDSRCTVGGSRVTTARIFRGVVGDDAHDIISLIYDSQHNVIGNSIPLEVISFQGNVSTKVIPPCQTMADLANDEIVTLVTYSDTGHVVEKRQLAVENTNYILRANVYVKHITHISLECPFLSSTDPTLINLPINVALTGLNLRGRVHYSNGDTVSYPVDGTRFTLEGLNNFIATQAGQEIPVVLRLRLEDDETSYDTDVSGVTMNRVFRIATTSADGAYNVKLYCAPVWQDAVNGYTLRWFMYNLDRQTTREVTSEVTLTPESVVFNPTSYGVAQNLVVAVNLQDVNAASVPYRYVQSVTLTLMAQGTARTTNWAISYVNAQANPYGLGLHAEAQMVNVNLYRLKVGSGIANINDWLDRIYYDGKPIFDPQREGGPVVPNYFIVIANGQEFEFMLEEWNSVLQIGTSVPVNGTVLVKFIRRTQVTDLQLGIAPMSVWDLAV